MIQRGGEVVIRMLENVKQRTIEPLIKATITTGTLVYTDEYAIYNSLQDWGYAHKTVCHGKAFGHFCGLGYDLIVVYLKKSCLCIWASLSLFIMLRGGVKLC